MSKTRRRLRHSHEIPKALGRLLYDKDPSKAQRVMDALLLMDKLDLAKLQRAHDGT